MKRGSIVVIVLTLLIFANLSFAEEGLNPGSGVRGFTISGAYDGSYLHYEEKDKSGAFLDKDTGYMNGAAVEVRYESKKLFTRAIFEISGSDNAKYTGSLWDGTPLSMTTSERFWRVEGDLGYKIWDQSTATLTPYIGFGYREWKRGKDQLPDYVETYTWPYVAVGANWVWTIDRWSVGADAAIQIPFGMEMKTDTAGAFDNATYKLKSNPGFRAELPVTYDIVTKKSEHSPRVFVFLTPYYQYWKIGASNDVTLTRNGVPVVTAYESDSDTNIFGAKIGIGINF